MTKMTLEDAQAHLSEIVSRLAPDEEILLTRDNKPVATIKAAATQLQVAPRLGTLRGTILHIAPDFDAIPEGFEDYHS